MSRAIGRIGNRRLVDELGFAFRYPNYWDGLAASGNRG